MRRLSSWCARGALLTALVFSGVPLAQQPAPAAARAPVAARVRQGWQHPWGPEAVVYGVVPSLFGKQPFKDVTVRLPRLRALGVNTLWLSPVTRTIPGDFGYSVTSYFDLREDYGTKDDFRALVTRAHELGMKVLIDFVPNHTAQEHPFFQDALKRGKASPWFDYYLWQAPGVPQHYFDWKHLPNLNFDNPLVDDMVLDALEYWVREFDIDGYRLDVAWGIQRRDPALWPRARRSLDQLEPQVLLIAEASAKDPWFYSHGFDAAYDWTRELGHWAWEKVWDDKAQIAPRLREALADAERPPGGMVMRFLNNNDTGERFITKHGPDVTRVAAALLITLPGIPCIYTGDEVGAEYQPYQEPPPLTWQDKHGLEAHYTRLVALRQKLPALRSRYLDVLDTQPGTALAYLRTEQPGRGNPVLVVLNFSGQPADVRVSVPQNVLAGAALTDALSGERVTVQRSGAALTVSLPAWGIRVLTSAP